MNYYKHHIGDYAAATAHLTWDEDMAYTKLLRVFYRDERPLPADIAATCRLVRAGTKPQKDAVARVLQEFFSLTADGWVQGRAEKEVIRKNEIRDANRLIALEREATKRARSDHETFTHADADRAPSHKPLATSHKEAITPVVPGGDSEASPVIDAYHQKLPKCQRVAFVNPKRKKRIAMANKLARQLASEQGWEWDAHEFWAAYFVECSADPWMRGEVPNPKNPNWRQNLDVLLSEDRFAAVMDKAIASMRAENE